MRISGLAVHEVPDAQVLACGVVPHVLVTLSAVQYLDISKWEKVWH
jgi:hypothetical protein